jgi:hypothetical protein
MRKSWWGGAVALLVGGMTLAGFTPPVSAQGADPSEEVRRAIDRAAGAAVAAAIAETLSRSIVSESITQAPKTTVFGSPFYTRADGDIDTISFEADIFGANVGFLHKISDNVLVHTAFTGAAGNARGRDDDEPFDIDGHLIDFRLGTDLIFLNTEPAKAWFTLEGGLVYFAANSEGFDPIWAWRIAPSTTFSFRAGPVLIEPTVGFQFVRPFTGEIIEDEDRDLIVTFNPALAVRYRGEKLRPQLNVAYQRVLTPKTISKNDDGFISVGPEILYAITPNLLVGGSYTYTTSFSKDVDINAHTILLEARWTF